MLISKQKGFTLVEILTVLVIIGLLIGGVMKAQGMITNSKLKRIETDNAGIAVAILSYEDRYRRLPGDDDRADQQFSIYTDGVNDPAPVDINGDSSGGIDGSWNGAVNSETANFWKHLRAAGLIDGDADDDEQPLNADAGKIGVRDGSLMIRGHVTVFGRIDGKIAKILEDRMDDGAFATGFVQSDITAALMDGAAISSIVGGYLESSKYFVAYRL
jgi:prepilin-type N-terminal cleavage/methylation domain-containing protein